MHSNDMKWNILRLKTEHFLQNIPILFTILQPTNFSDSLKYGLTKGVFKQANGYSLVSTKENGSPMPTKLIMSISR